MKNRIKRILGMVLACVLTVGMAFEPSYASYNWCSGVEYPEVFTIYNYGQGDESLTFCSDDSNFTFKSVKSSNKAVATAGFLRYSNEISRDVGRSYDSCYNQFDIWVTPKKVGKTNLSVKCSDGETYKVKVVVKKYENPVSSFTIQGINKGKSIADKFNKTPYITLTSTSKVKNIIASIKPKKNWRIKNMTLQALKDYYSYDFGQYYFESLESKKRVMYIPDINTSEYDSCYIDVTFENIYTLGEEPVRIYLK